MAAPQQISFGIGSPAGIPNFLTFGLFPISTTAIVTVVGSGRGSYDLEIVGVGSSRASLSGLGSLDATIEGRGSNQ